MSWGRRERRAYQESLERDMNNYRPGGTLTTRPIPPHRKCPTRLHGEHDFSNGGRCWYCCRRKEETSGN